MPDPLAPCPNCTSTLGPFLANPDGIEQVICSTCGMRGPYANMVGTAAQKWDGLPRRADSAPPAATSKG